MNVLIIITAERVVVSGRGLHEPSVQRDHRPKRLILCFIISGRQSARKTYLLSASSWWATWRGEDDFDDIIFLLEEEINRPHRCRSRLSLTGFRAGGGDGRRALRQRPPPGPLVPHRRAIGRAYLS